MRSVREHLQEIRDWYKRVREMNVPMIAVYRNYMSIDWFSIDYEWCIDVVKNDKPVEIIGKENSIDVATIELGTDTFAIVDNALLVIEVNDRLIDENRYVRVLIPQGSAFDINRVRALMQMGLAPEDAMRVVAIQ